MVKRSRLASILAAVVMASTAVLGTSMSAEAATGAGGIPILYASAGNQAHECNVFGSDQYGHQAVVCADLVTGLLGSQYWVEGRLEAYCQTSTGVEVQCAEIDGLGGVLANPGTSGIDIGDGYCGHDFGPCPAGRFYAYSRANFYYDSSVWQFTCASNPNSITQVWAVAYGATVRIELPQSDKWVDLGPSGLGNDGYNESSGHNYICP